MGTRNLVAVFVDGKYQIAQYGQWDGYPSGQGLTVLKFVRDGLDLQRFLKALENVRFVGEEEYKQKWIDAGADPKEPWVSSEVEESEINWRGFIA